MNEMNYEQMLKALSLLKEISSNPLFAQASEMENESQERIAEKVANHCHCHGNVEDLLEQVYNARNYIIDYVNASLDKRAEPIDLSKTVAEKYGGVAEELVPSMYCTGIEADTLDDALAIFKKKVPFAKIKYISL